MLHLLNESLEVFLRAVVLLAKDAVDVSFEAPDRDLRAKVGTRPMVDIYLWDVRRKLAERDAGSSWSRASTERSYADRRCRALIAGTCSRRAPPTSRRALACGDVLVALLRHPQIDERHLQDGYAAIRPVAKRSRWRCEGAREARTSGPPRGAAQTGLEVVVTATIDAVRPEAVGPPTEAFELTTTAGEARSSRRFAAGRTTGPPGSLVETTHGAATVSEDVAYLISSPVGSAAGDKAGLLDASAPRAAAGDGPTNRAAARPRRKHRSFR